MDSLKLECERSRHRLESDGKRLIGDAQERWRRPVVNMERKQHFYGSLHIVKDEWQAGVERCGSSGEDRTKMLRSSVDAQ